MAICIYIRCVKVETSAAARAKQRSEPGQLVLFKPRGGKRRGAGRPPKGARAGSPHKERPFLHARYPVHVTLRVVGAVGNLRRRCVYQAIREATLTTARREDFRIVQLSIQRTHVHLLVETDDKRALARGMQGFQTGVVSSAAAGIDDLLDRRVDLVSISIPRSSRTCWSSASSSCRPGCAS
jgi:hypothetical protein